MHARFINELVEGAHVDAVYFLRGREMRTARSGDAYLLLELGDRTGHISAVLFKPSAEASAIPARSAVRVSGRVTTYRRTKRISVESLTAADVWEPTELIGGGLRPVQELRDELRALVSSMTDPSLKRLVTAVFANAAFFERFCACPASQSYHHAYVGGLLEHTISVAGMCKDASEKYDGVDSELLLAAALLHDVGKVDELTFDTGIGYSDEGRLIGHVVSGVQRVRDAARSTKLRGERLLCLEHAILSHHGELEWGSPKRPSTFEALLLHHIDNLDAKAAGFSALMKGASLIEESWTDATNLFRRPLYAPRAMEDERACRPSEDDQHFRLSA